MKTHIPTQRDIEAVLDKMARHAKHLDIGPYISHTMDESGDCRVLLANGKLLLHYAEVKDAEKLPAFRIADMAARFHASK